MKKIKFTVQNILLLFVIVGSFVACEREFATIGSGIISENDFGTSSQRYSVITYNKDLGAIQTNDMPALLLGYNNDPLYGDYTASFVCQMTAAQYDPVFGQNVVLDSVVLTLPYFSVQTDTDEDGNGTYEIDSVFGDAPIRLSIYENRYFLRTFNPELEFDDELKYFSNKTSSDGNMISDGELEGTLLYTTDEFLPSADEIVLTVEDEFGEVNVSSRIAPALRVKLDNPGNFWENMFLNREDDIVLSNESNFLDHFRGLYFKAETLGSEGNLTMFSFGDSASLNIYYSNDLDEGDDDNDGIPNLADADVDGDGVIDNGPDSDGDGINDDFDVDQTGGLDEDGDGIDDARIEGSGNFAMNFNNNRVNFLDSNFMTIPEGDPIDGDERLYLKGGDGSMAIINLFNGDEEGNSDELEDFKAQNWLINQAQLVFFVDQDAIMGKEPERVIIYDLNNNTPLIDYFIDQSVSATQINAKIDHLKPLERVDDDPEGAGIKYKIEITEHINNIFLRDSTNVKLGLMVTSNVNTIDGLDVLDDDDVSRVLSGAVLSPRGTVLFGNNTTDEEKKVQLEIFYTEPDN